MPRRRPSGVSAVNESPNSMAFSSVYDVCSDSATFIACSSTYSNTVGSSYRSRLRRTGGLGGHALAVGSASVGMDTATSASLILISLSICSLCLVTMSAVASCSI
ncbi:hypothetical protein BpHYR1_047720 [Brachionus plicatilis]|uniref:Uncharacterized protein n=1 Tax=Brachionus plicatilis TaxID=10195 RepID=A0A3M7PQG7_BRAPC|nr:hypothetical protein BpHYR1_047720 [Brachionus plicatilis]